MKNSLSKTLQVELANDIAHNGSLDAAIPIYKWI